MSLARNEPTAEELITAFNDIESAEEILVKYGLSKEELSTKAEALAKKLADECTNMNIV
ncbi:MAG: hypothetical protein JO131_00920 [Gammaproteobacteria bacterium]|nr:hypothetical protein [Gammaproteobacteria bacterium]